MEAYQASNSSVGARTIANMVIVGGMKMGRVLAERLMAELGLKSCQLPAHKYKLGSREHVDIPNVLERQFAVSELNQIWCGDVIYIWTDKGLIWRLCWICFPVNRWLDDIAFSGYGAYRKSTANDL